MIFKQEPAPEGPGNIWGPKFTLISLGIILFFLALAYFRWIQLGKPSLQNPPPAVEAPVEN
jgi:hypothetical protein